jgi:hypothetical protein
MLLIAFLACAQCVQADAPQSQDRVTEQEVTEQEAQIYRQWYEAQLKKDNFLAIAAAKQYIKQYPNGVYAEYLRRWLSPVERVDTSVIRELIKLRCYVVENYTYASGNPAVSQRGMALLMQEEAFSENNLRKLFDVLSRNFPQPDDLGIIVVTTEAQVQNRPSNRPSDSPEAPGYYDHHRAEYRRRGNDESFRFTEQPTDRRLKTVTLRGNDQLK